MMDWVGVMLKVAGRSKLIAAVVPMPGRTPVSVPMKDPDKTDQQVHGFEGDIESQVKMVEEIHGFVPPISPKRLWAIGLSAGIEKGGRRMPRSEEKL